MEGSLANFITQNLADLTVNARIDTHVLVLMVQDGVLSEYEKEAIKLQRSELDKSEKFYSFLRRKTNQELLKTLNVFKKTNQSQFVVQKLEEFLDLQAADCGNCAEKNKEIEKLLGEIKEVENEIKVKHDREVETLRKDLTESNVKLQRENKTLRKDLSTEREKSLKLAMSVTDLEGKIKLLLNRLEKGPIKNIPSGLLSFEYTESLALAVMLKNSTSTHFLQPNKYYHYEGTREYFPMPLDEIPPFSECGFGFTYKPSESGNPLRGLFSFQINETKMVALYAVHNEFNSLGLAFLPPNDPIDGKLLNEIRGGFDWSKSPEKCKVFKEYWTKNGKKDKLEVCLQFQSICVEATMTTQEQKVLNMEIKEISK